MSEPASNAGPPDIETMFLGGGGRLASGLQRLWTASRARAGQSAALAVGLCWLPLLLLAMVDNVAWGERIAVTLLEDFLPYGQFLLALPILILGEVTLARRLGLAAAELRRSSLLAEQDTPEFDRLLARAGRAWRGRGIDLAFVGVSAAVTALSLAYSDSDFLTGGWEFVDGRVTLAGWWYLIVSMTLLRFAELRWFWRLALWSWLLWRTARLALRPMPLHPDRAGGLGFLGFTQTAFAPLVLGFGAQLSCLVAGAVHYHGADLMAYKFQLIAFVAVALTGLLTPLLAFAGPLSRARHEAIVVHSGSAYRGTAGLDRVLRGEPTEVLPSDQISALCDLSPLLENARRMSAAPFAARDIVVVVLAAVLPLAPLAFLIMPVKDVLRALMALLVG